MRWFPHKKFSTCRSEHGQPSAREFLRIPGQQMSLVYLVVYSSTSTIWLWVKIRPPQKIWALVPLPRATHLGPLPIFDHASQGVRAGLGPKVPGSPVSGTWISSYFSKSMPLLTCSVLKSLPRAFLSAVLGLGDCFRTCSKTVYLGGGGGGLGGPGLCGESSEDPAAS